MGRTEAQVISLNGGATTATFTQGAVGNPIAGRTANVSPNCTSGCGLTLNASTNNGYNIPSNTTLCVPQGISLGGNITFNSGSRLRVCGVVNPQNINYNGGGRLHLIITSTGVWNGSTINMNSTTDTLVNYGNVNLNQTLNSQGYVGNYGNISISQTLNNNSNSFLYNFSGANIRVSESFNNNQRVINEGFIAVSRSVNNNGSAEFTNSCRLVVSENINQNNTFSNLGYVTAGSQTIYNGSSNTTIGAGSLWVTRDAQVMVI